MTALRYIDLVLLWLTVPLVLALGAPLLGVLLGSIVWTVQRVVALAVDRKARSRDSVREAIGLNMATMMVRMWLVVAAVLVAGLAGQRDDGAAAAVVLLIVFTISFATRLLTHSLDRSGARAGTATHA